MTKALSWILVGLVLAIGGSEQHTAFGIADQHVNVAKGKRISRSDPQDIIYDQKHLVDGKDTTASYLYFPRSLTITIDLGDSFTVRHVVIKVNPESFREMKRVEAKLSYARHASLPTLHHLFRANACAKSKKHENNFFIVILHRCCGRCCDWKLRGIGRFLTVTFEKKKESNTAFGVHEVEVRGLKSPSGLNLAIFKPVLEEHNASCMTSPFVANDAWTDELFTQVKRPPFRWRVDLGKAQKLGYVRFVYKGKWGSAKVILMNEQGVEYPDNSCPHVRMEVHQKNTICCNTADIDVATRWLEIRGEKSLPQLIEVFAYPRNFMLYLDECPKGTTTVSTSTVSTTAASTTAVTSQTTSEASGEPSAASEEATTIPTATYAIHPRSEAPKRTAGNFAVGAFSLLTALLALQYEIT